LCPYDTPDLTALRMATSGSGLPGAKTFVIAFNATDASAVSALQPIAVAGGTTNVLYATDRAGLQSALSAVLDSISATTTTRTAPAFSSGSSGGQSQVYQFQSSFAVASGYPWEGVLERERTVCQGSPTPVPVAQDVDHTCLHFCDDYGYAL